MADRLSEALNKLLADQGKGEAEAAAEAEASENTTTDTALPSPITDAPKTCPTPIMSWEDLRAAVINRTITDEVTIEACDEKAAVNIRRRLYRVMHNHDVTCYTIKRSGPLVTVRYNMAGKIVSK